MTSSSCCFYVFFLVGTLSAWCRYGFDVVSICCRCVAEISLMVFINVFLFVVHVFFHVFFMALRAHGDILCVYGGIIYCMVILMCKWVHYREWYKIMILIIVNLLLGRWLIGGVLPSPQPQVLRLLVKQAGPMHTCSMNTEVNYANLSVADVYAVYPSARGATLSQALKRRVLGWFGACSACKRSLM